MNGDKLNDWLMFLPRYYEIERMMNENPAARAALQDHPGIKFMQKGMTIFWCIIFVLAILGG